MAIVQNSREWMAEFEKTINIHETYGTYLLTIIDTKFSNKSFEYYFSKKNETVSIVWYGITVT